MDSRHVDMADFIANNGTMPGMGAWGGASPGAPCTEGLSLLWDTRMCGFRAPLAPATGPPPEPPSSTLGCPAKKNVCDSNTCHNGGTCVNQWDSFSCECPLGFGGKSCAQGRRRG